MGIDEHAYDTMAFHVIRCVKPHTDLARERTPAREVVVVVFSLYVFS